MKILVTGSNGQLGSELKQLAPDFQQYTFVFTDIGELDITNEVQVRELCMKERPGAIINCAGYTAVDKAEEDFDRALKLNATAVGYLAEGANSVGALFFHISTDYVFKGDKGIPYIESDSAEPQSAYARTKLSGELACLQKAERGVVIRTSWLYSEFMHNFVKTILFKGIERGKLNVVFDQVGSPTYAHDLALTLLTIIPQLNDWKGHELYHYSNEGVASWYDFAKAIVEYSGITCEINPIVTAEYPLPASRPFYSLMDKSKIKKTFGISISHWRESLQVCLKKIKY